MYSVQEPTKGDNEFLGVCVPEIQTKKKILVLKTFYYFPVEIQLSLIHEIVRLSSNIFFEQTSDKSILDLYKIFDKAGFSFQINNVDNYLSVAIERYV